MAKVEMTACQQGSGWVKQPPMLEPGYAKRRNNAIGGPAPISQASNFPPSFPSEARGGGAAHLFSAFGHRVSPSSALLPSPKFPSPGIASTPMATRSRGIARTSFERVLLGFSDASDHDLEKLTGAVLGGLYGNPAFPTPPVLKPALQTALSDFTSAIAAQAQGGTAATATKKNRRDAHISLLRILAAYVQQTANNN